MADSVIRIQIEIDCDAVKACLEMNDFVEVIRCKDCVSWDTSWNPEMALEGAYWCSTHDTYMFGNDYCSMAERKKEE